MLSRRSLVVARAGTRLLASDPAPLLVTIIMPLLLAAFLMPSTRALLRVSGYAGANGSEQLIPGLGVAFAFLGTSLIGTLFFREHAWGTWDRLRASPLSTVDIVVGKVLPLYVCQLAQLAVIFGAGAWLFGYRANGSLVALALVVAIFVAMLVAFGVMLVSLFRTMDQAMVIGNLGGMVMAGLGGALAPASALPGWAQAVAHATPAYWALKALREITLDGAGLSQVGASVAILGGFAVAFAAVTALRWRTSDVKIGTT
jgi:ABC-2 type transport system permease protein